MTTKKKTPPNLLALDSEPDPLGWKRACGPAQVGTLLRSRVKREWAQPERQDWARGR
jgi:hypothetical protein